MTEKTSRVYRHKNTYMHAHTDQHMHAAIELSCILKKGSAPVYYFIHNNSCSGRGWLFREAVLSLMLKVIQNSLN